MNNLIEKTLSRLVLNMKCLVLAIAAMVVAVLGGCNQQETVATSKAIIVVAGGAAAVTQARKAYSSAVIALESDKDKFPEDVQKGLYAIKANADALISMVENKTNTTTGALEFVAGDGERFYDRLHALYGQGKELIAPYRNTLSETTQWALDDLSAVMDKLEKANKLYKENPTAVNAAQVARLAMSGLSAGITLFSALSTM